MRQAIIIVGLIYSLTSCQSETKLFTADNSKIGVKYKGARGTIFNDNYPFSNFLTSDVDSTTRWTPKRHDIELAEDILRKQIKSLNKNKVNQLDNCPLIHRHLNDYFRQYVGVKNSEGQRIIHINFSWDKHTLIDRIVGNADSRLKFTSDYSFVFDGCSYYWAVNVNLDKRQLSDLSINGVG
jgi:hypothetical protein